MANLTDRCKDLMNQIALTKKRAQLRKSAFAPPSGGPGGGDPGAPPMDPSMMGGAPPMDPSMMGGAPPMDPSMMGGAPPGGGAPPMDPSMLASIMGDSDGGGSGGKKGKLDPNLIYNRLTKIMKLLIFLCNSLGADKIPADLLLDEGESMPSSSMKDAMPSVGGPEGPSDGSELSPTAAGPETKEGAYKIGSAIRDPWASENPPTSTRNRTLSDRAKSLTYFMAKDAF